MTLLHKSLLKLILMLFLLAQLSSFLNLDCPDLDQSLNLFQLYFPILVSLVNYDAGH
jgi:hypothetical protein